MTASRILLVGGSGFIGYNLAARLSSKSIRVIVPTRRLTRARHLMLLPMVELEQADLFDDAQLESLMQGCDTVVNLAGILHGSWGEPYGPEFARTHVELPRRLAAACARKGLRLLHVSALGVADGDANDAPSMYLRSKTDGERVIRSTPGLAWTIFRPSVVFGRDDRFLNMLAAMQRLLPVLPLARAQTKFQPVFVGDVAQAIVNAIDNPATIGKTYELAGPEVFTLAELARLAGRWGGRQRPIWALPYTLGQLQAAFLGVLPNPMMSIDNFDSMKIDNVAHGPIAPELGIVPTPVAAVVPEYLAQRTRFSDERKSAHR